MDAFLSVTRHELEQAHRQHRELTRLSKVIPKCSPRRAEPIRITPQIRRDQAYLLVVRYWQKLGRQMLGSEADRLSELFARRASDIYEYWVLLALMQCIVECGFEPKLDDVITLVRRDVYHLDVRSGQVFRFENPHTQECVELQYEPRAHDLSRKPKSWKRRPAEVITAEEGLPPGLYSLIPNTTPDYLITLRHGHREVFAIADAIFDSALATPAGDELTRGVLEDKPGKVANYGRKFFRVTPQGVVRPHVQGVVIFCGTARTAQLLEERSSHSDEVIFLPLAPTLGSSWGKDGLVSRRAGLDLIRTYLHEEALPVFAELLQELRGHSAVAR